MAKKEINSYKKVLVANRGEIAVRIIKTLKKLGLRSVAVYTEVDKASPHVKIADEAIQIGEGPLGASYLSIDRIIAVAHQTNAEAIHPGYGFLSENAEFAKQCENNNLIFVGPKHNVIHKMANKKMAKEIAKDAGVPCLPGYSIRKTDSLDEIMDAAKGIGYPLMIKATAGGGGKGMRLVKNKNSLNNDLNIAKAESLAAFGSDEVILEKAMNHFRHIEVQVFGDQKGNLIHLGERDCSIQRRNQKVIEEAPAPSITETLREKLYEAALKLATAINYSNAGTVEFLVDENENIYFLEMNTRLQVEHAVTELITGFDLVEMQFRTADGQDLSVTQKDINFSGHAIEVRLYAEDPRNEFLPSSGSLDIWKFKESQSIRIDSGVDQGQYISPLYDAMLAKVIVHTANRKKSILGLGKFLSNFSISGIKNNRDFLIDILDQKDFLEAKINTSFLSKIYPEGVKLKEPVLEDFAISAVYHHETVFGIMQEESPLIPNEFKNWSNLKYLGNTIKLECLGVVRKVSIFPMGKNIYKVETENQGFTVTLANKKISINGSIFQSVSFSETDEKLYLIKKDCSFEFLIIDSPVDFSPESSTGIILSPIHGNISAIYVKLHQNVKAGDKLAILEAMKLQHEIIATTKGKIKVINCSVGAQISADDILMEIETEQ